MMMTQGIGQFDNEARRLASLGRNGDVYIAHLSEGETVVPMEIFDANPEMRSMLFSQMKSMGIEPERYIVGNELNSINPETGQPEFFLKRVFSGVKDVLKQTAPILVPIAINMAFPTATPFQKAALSAAASGITSLATGAERDEALRNALISGAISGVGSAMQGAAPVAEQTARPGASVADLTPRDINPDSLQRAASTDIDLYAAIRGDAADYLAGNPDDFANVAERFDFSQYAYAPDPAEPSFFKSFFNQPAPTGAELANTREFQEARQAYLDSGFTKDVNVASKKALEDLTAKYTPTALDKFGLPALGIGALAFLPEEEIEEEEQMSIQEYIDANYPDDYFDMDITQRRAQGPFEVPPTVGFGAEGGDPAFFPRRIGAIGPGIGSGTEDDVPAMLMDGEFVFTKKAVNGLGGGDENKGMQRMYDLMRNFEAMA